MSDTADDFLAKRNAAAAAKPNPLNVARSVHVNSDDVDAFFDSLPEVTLTASESATENVADKFVRERNAQGDAKSNALLELEKSK